MNLSDWLKEVRARIEAATPGPWQAKESMYKNRVAVINGPTDYMTDAEFIAHSRTDLPRALDIIENQARQIEVMREALIFYGGNFGPHQGTVNENTNIAIMTKLNKLNKIARDALASVEKIRGELRE